MLQLSMVQSPLQSGPKRVANYALGPAEQSRYDSRKRRKIEEEEHAEDIQLSSDGSSQESDDQTTQSE